MSRREADDTDAVAYGAGADVRAAERLLDKRRAALARVADARIRKQRAYALLARNGFDPDVCRQAVARFLDPGGNPESLSRCRLTGHHIRPAARARNPRSP